MGKQLILIGLVIVFAGIVWLNYSRYFQWIGNLPGDLKWSTENTKIYLPLGTMLVISLFINLVYWLYKWFSK